MPLLEKVVFGGAVLWLLAQLLLFAWLEKSRPPAMLFSQRHETPGARGTARRWTRMFLCAGPARAIIETLLAQSLLIGLSLLGYSLAHVQFGDLESNILILGGPGCILWCALRLRFPAGSWWRQALYDGAVGAALGPVLLPMLLAAPLLFGLRENVSVQMLLEEGTRYFPELLAALLMALIGVMGLFLFLRIGARLWLRWNRMRRTRLRWALTHAHLLVVVLGAALLGMLLLSVEVITSTGFPFYVLSVLVGLMVFTGIALAIVLPPSAIFSYLFARRIVRRIEGLAGAAGALRRGNYSIRVPVVGEDEIARLQADFNAMAADLERTMRELQEERDAVATLLKARRELIASVSHELRTPIATLRGYLESTRAHWDETPPPTLRQDLQIMEQETIRLQTLIDDLFTLARAEVGKLEMRCQPVDAGALARRVAATLAPLAWQAGRVEVIAAVSDEPSLVCADPSRLEQALHNLAHNGVRHTPPGGIVALLVQSDADSVTLQVKDTGEGIAPADLPRIWERFYRAENSRARADGGSGLGLALVKELTEAMGGSVAVESTPGEGSCFTLRFCKAGGSRESMPLAAPERLSRPALPEPEASALGRL